MLKTRLNLFSIVASFVCGVMLLGVIEARGQDNLCSQPEPLGWLQVIVNEAAAPASNDVDFNDAILGTFDQVGAAGHIVGDADWFYNEEAFSTADDLEEVLNFVEQVVPTLGANTTIVGTQAVFWWTQAGDRNTVFQITNSAQKFTCPCPDPPCPGALPFFDEFGNCENSQEVLLTGENAGTNARVSLHIQIFGEDCNEIDDFCDTMSAFDTHSYDLGPGALVTNDGAARSTAVLQGREGFITVTPVVNCPGDMRAIDWNYLHGSVRIADTFNQFGMEYGYNAFMRDTIDCHPTCFGENGDLAGDLSACILSGPATGCQFREMNADNNTIRQNFNTIGAASRSDVVFINFGDTYDNVNTLFGYSPTAALVNLSPGQRDANEEFGSCPLRTVCFDRFALNSDIPGSDEPIPPIATPTPTPTLTPTPTPGCTENDDCPLGQICGDFVEPDMGVCIPGCTEDHGCPSGQVCDPEDATDENPGVCVATPPPSTAPPSFIPRQGSSGSCTSIAGAAPVQLGTAMANILIPLVPALAIGLRVIRRRKKGQK